MTNNAFSPDPESYTKFVTALVSPHSMQSFETKLGTMGLGLAGEAGEIATLVSLYCHEGLEWTETNTNRLIDELSDICWYVAFGAAHVLEVRFDELYTQLEVCPKTDPARQFKDSYVHLMKNCGAIADIVKKLLYHGKPYNDKIRHDLIERMRNVMAAVMLLASEVCCCEIKDLLEHNIAKLSERYKSLTFTTEAFMAKEQAQCETSPSP